MKIALFSEKFNILGKFSGIIRDIFATDIDILSIISIEKVK